MKKSLGAKTILHPAPVLLVGTYDAGGRPNLMTVAWGGICCSDPPCVAISLRKATYSYGNIVARKAFTVNVPSESQVEKADFCGMVSGRKEDKFSTCKLTPVKSEAVDAPYGKEFLLVLECKLLQTVEIGLHTQFIGAIVDVKADEAVLGESGYPDITKVKPCIYVPGEQKYYGVGKFLGKGFEIGKGVK
ncbi:MAG: flavin reductase family protein [Candidatus Eisenbacteria bacterium]